MKPDDIKRERSLLYMEGYVDEATKTRSVLAPMREAAPCCRPQSDQPSFDLITVIALSGRVSGYEAGAHAARFRTLP